MSLKTRLGNLGNILDEDETQCRLLQLESPVLTNAEFAGDARLYGRDGDARSTAPSIRPTVPARNRRCATRSTASARGRGRGARRLRPRRPDRQGDQGRRARAIPMILADRRRAHASGAPAAAHLHLAQRALGRMPRHALLRGADRRRRHHGQRLPGAGDDRRPASPRPVRRASGCETRSPRYKKAIDDGLLKIMSKMGISVISSYRGGYNFEAVGLSRSLVAEFFPGMPSRISGIGLPGIQLKALDAARARLGRRRHRAAGRRLLPLPPRRRDARLRRRHDPHAAERGRHATPTRPIKKYSEACASRRRSSCATCSTSTARAEPCRSTRSNRSPRSASASSRPACRSARSAPRRTRRLSIAMNRIGAKSVSGEGGEDPARYKPRPNGDNASRRSSRSPRAASASPPNT